MNRPSDFELPGSPYVGVKRRLNPRSLLQILNAHDTQAMPPLLRECSPPTMTAALTLLRSWVDEWLDSAYRNGKDEPSKRSLKNTSLIWAGMSFRGWTIEPSARWNAFSIQLDEGSYDLKASNLQRNPEQEMAFAQYHLLSIFLAGLQAKLAKCRQSDCGKYFLLKQSKRVYVGGTRCPKCYSEKRKEESAEGMERRYKSAGDILRTAVATEFRSELWANPHPKPTGDLKDRITTFVNRKLRASPSLQRIYKKNEFTTKWIADHRNWDAVRKLAHEVT